MARVPSSERIIQQAGSPSLQSRVQGGSSSIAGGVAELGKALIRKDERDERQSLINQAKAEKLVVEERNRVMTQSILNAQTAVHSFLYDKDNGLLQRQGDEVKGSHMAYKQFREQLESEHTKGLDEDQALAFQKTMLPFLNKLDATVLNADVEATRKAQLDALNNASVLAFDMVGVHYQDDEMISQLVDQVRSVENAKSDQLNAEPAEREQANRTATGAILKAAVESAISREDFDRADELIEMHHDTMGTGISQEMRDQTTTKRGQLENRLEVADNRRRRDTQRAVVAKSGEKGGYEFLSTLAFNDPFATDNNMAPDEVVTTRNDARKNLGLQKKAHADYLVEYNKVLSQQQKIRNLAIQAVSGKSITDLLAEGRVQRGLREQGATDEDIAEFRSLGGPPLRVPPAAIDFEGLAPDEQERVAAAFNKERQAALAEALKDQQESAAATAAVVKVTQDYGGLMREVVAFVESDTPEGVARLTDLTNRINTTMPPAHQAVLNRELARSRDTSTPHRESSKAISEAITTLLLAANDGPLKFNDIDPDEIPVLISRVLDEMHKFAEDQPGGPTADAYQKFWKNNEALIDLREKKDVEAFQLKFEELILNNKLVNPEAARDFDRLRQPSGSGGRARSKNNARAARAANLSVKGAGAAVTISGGGTTDELRNLLANPQDIETEQ